MDRRALLVGVATCVIAASAVAQEPIKMRISIEVAGTHKRTELVQKYADEVNKRSGGKLQAEVFHSAQLFRDRDVAKALRQGGAEMATPGPWNLTGIEPNMDLPQVPSMYGRSAEEVHRISDGEVGKLMNDMLEKKLGVKVIGRWLDLGASNSFSTAKPLNSPSDLKGLKIRTSGGAGQMVRVKFFDGIANFTAWPDVPLALSQGTFDGLFTTNESTQSAKLWESGVKYSLQDQQFYAQYMPMVSGTFWSKLSPDLQKVVTGAWEEHIDGMRKTMAEAQAKALETMKQNGITVVVPTKAQIEETRARLMTTQDEVIKDLKLDKALVEKTNAVLGIGKQS